MDMLCMQIYWGIHRVQLVLYTKLIGKHFQSVSMVVNVYNYIETCPKRLS